MPILPLHGHDALRARLSALADANRLPGSILLAGPRGVGKQRLALWLGQRLLCAAPGQRPCDACQPCRYARALTHPDLHWYFPRPRLKGADADDPAKVREDLDEEIARRGEEGGAYAAPDGTAGIFVATILSLVARAAVTPAMGARKVFVIGDAERMVPQEGSDMAANAFLKLLEEPPADSTIVITSSEAGALLPTIRSRVVAFRVAPLPEDAARRVIEEPAFAAALDADDVPRGTPERVRLAEGAPGTLLGAAGRGAARENARRLLDAVREGREQCMRAAFAQGSAGARGAFSDALDEMVLLLRERAREAARRGDERAAVGASRAVERVERAKALATGNVSPNLVTAGLLRELAEAL